MAQGFKGAPKYSPKSVKQRISRFCAKTSCLTLFKSRKAAPWAQIASSKAPKDALLVAESGIFTATDVEKLASQGAEAYLIGESFMRQDDVAGALKVLRNQ